MKITCPSDELYEGLQLVGGVTATSTTKPILQAVRMETKGDMLELSGTDLEVGLRYQVGPVSVDEPGVVVLPGARIVGLLREWPGREVRLEVKENACSLLGKGCKFRLLGYDEKEFPVIPVFSGERFFEIEAEKVGEMVKKTVFACASERLRHTMTGVLMDVAGETLSVVATDGRRMALVKEQIRNKEGGSRKGIIPSKGMQQLPKIASRTKGELKVELEETHLVARGERGEVCCQLIEGQYPNYEEAIPKEEGERVEIDAEELASAISRAAFLTTEERHVIRIRLCRNKMAICAETPEVGEGEIGLEVGYRGKEMELGFNPDFLLDALKAIGKEKVRVAFKDPSTAVTLRAGRDYLYVVMPVRLSET